MAKLELLELKAKEVKAQYAALRASEVAKIEEWTEKSKRAEEEFKTLKAKNQCYLREGVQEFEEEDSVTKQVEELGGSAEEFRQLCSQEPSLGGLELQQATAMFEVMMKYMTAKFQK